MITNRIAADEQWIDPGVADIDDIIAVGFRWQTAFDRMPRAIRQGEGSLMVGDRVDYTGHTFRP